MKSKFKVGDWVKFQGIKGNLIGRIIKIQVPELGLQIKTYVIIKKDIQYNRQENEIQKYPYTHSDFSLGWFRFSFFKLGKRFTLRLELARGW